VTASDALEDLLRAARAEVVDARPPWRATRATATAPLTLSIGKEPTGGEEPPSLTGPAPSAARTDRAASVLAFAHPVRVLRAKDAEGETVGLRIEVRDASAAAVGARMAEGTALPARAEAAVRAHLRAAAGGGDPLDPARLVAVLGVFRAVERELEEAFREGVGTSAAQVVAANVPREASRKAPVHREVVGRLAAAFPAFPEHRVTDVVEALNQGDPPTSLLRPPDVAVVLAVLGLSWPGGKPFGERVLPLGAWTDEDVRAAVGETTVLGALRGALDKGRDPGEGWVARFEAAAFGLLGRLARLAGGSSSRGAAGSGERTRDPRP
jgi:hypothetical protein